MYVLKTRFSSYVTGVVGGGGMIENDSDEVSDALLFESVEAVIAFLRQLPPLSINQQNRLNIHRVEAPEPPPLVDMGPIL